MTLDNSTDLPDREKQGMKLLIDGDEKIRYLSTYSEPKKKFPAYLIAPIAPIIVFTLALLIICYIKKKDELNDMKASELTSKEIVTPTAVYEETVTPTTIYEDIATPNTIHETSIQTTRRRFTYYEVLKITNNYQIPIGEGGFGIVYYGDLDGSQQVAVKLLSQSSAQGYKAEVELLLRVHHINLVNLVGYCDERDHIALVYEYMSNGDLKHQLSGNNGGSILSRSTRLRIAIDAALGLEYLHNGCRPSLVHRDVKTTNILLDDKFTAKIADFGLSRSFKFENESHVSTDIAGTPGYLDPEYYRTGRLYEKSDVYSFGIVLLEMITNQLVVNQNRDKPHIVEWTTFMLKRGDVTRIIDPYLDGGYNSQSVWRAIELAMCCVNPLSDKRPNMLQVVAELKECLSSETR